MTSDIFSESLAGVNGPRALELGLKRVVDVVLVVAFAPLLLPLSAGVALVVLVGQGRPVFFRQPRVGKSGRLFWIYKFRTMTMERDVDQRRATRLGSWLRSRGLDELPQLANVARGDMSLVGPRPLCVVDHARLVQMCPELARRVHVRPGLTGLVQVTMVVGAQHTARLEAAYVRHWSLHLDLTILVRTAWMNLRGKARGRLRPEWLAKRFKLAHLFEA